MTAKELSKLFYLNKEIQRDEERLRELEALSEGGSPVITGMPGIRRTSDKTATAADIADLEQEIKAKRQLCIIEYNRLNRYINTIDDAQVRLIMKLRHLDLFTWNEVATEIGGGNTEDSVRMMHTRYLKKQ